MTPTAFRGVVVLDTQAQFEELSTTGTLVIGTETITYQPTSYLYYVKEGGIGVTQQELNSAISLVTRQIPTVSKTGTTAPTSSTVADFVGQFYLDTATPKTYQCTAISSGVYTWTEVGGGGGSQSTPIYSHRVMASNGEEELIIQFYSTTEFFSDLSEFCDLLDNQPPVTGYYKNSSGNYLSIYSVERGTSSGDLVFYTFGVGETLYNMLQNIIKFNDDVVEI